MSQFGFFIEYDGQHTCPIDEKHPNSTIEAADIFTSTRLFAKKYGYKVASCDSLSEDSCRVFYNKKPLFGKSKEYIYYVREVQHSGSI